MLQVASTVVSKDGLKNQKLYIKEEKIFTAYLLQKKEKRNRGTGKKKRREKHQSQRVHKAFFPPSPSVTALALTFGAGISDGPLPSAWPLLR